MTAFDAVHPAVCDHVTRAVENQVNLFFHLVMVREIGATRLKFHDEQAGEHASGRDLVARAGLASHEELVEDGVGMAGDRLPLHFVEVGNGLFTAPAARLAAAAGNRRERQAEHGDVCAV